MQRSRVLDHFLLFVLCLIPFTTLIVFDEAIYPYITSKNFAFRILVDLVFGVWLAHNVLSDTYRIHRTRILNMLIVFLGVVLVADLVGQNFFNSLWSNYSRMEGYVSLLHYFFYFLVLSTVLNTREKWFLFLRILMSVSFIVLVIAVLQKFKIILAVDFNRVDATFGNSSYLGVYASLHFFLCGFLFFSEAQKSWKYFAGFLAICNLVSIYLSQTRSATLAVMAGLAICAFLALKNRRKVFLWATVFLILFIVSVFIFKSSGYRSTNLFARISQISLNDESTQARLAIWNYSFEAFKLKPFLGWGQENFVYLAKLYQPDLYSTPWVDRAHNFVLDWLVNTGLLGLLGYLGVLFVLLFYIVKPKNSTMGRMQRSILIGFLLCYVINNFFVFDFLSSLICLYTVLALVQFYETESTQKIRTDIISNQSTKRILALSVFAFFSLAINFWINVDNFLTNYQLRQITKPAYITAAAKKPPFNSGFEHLLQNSFFAGSEIRQQWMQTALYSVQLENAADYSRYLYEKIDQSLTDEMRKDSENLTLKYEAATFYTQFQAFDKSEKLFQELLAIVPKHQYYLLEYGNLRMTQGRRAEGLYYYEQAAFLDSNFYLGQVFLALGYIYNQRYDAADKVIQSLIVRNRDEAVDDRLINAYLSQNQIDSASKLLTRRNEMIARRKRD